MEVEDVPNAFESPDPIAGEGKDGSALGIRRGAKTRTTDWKKRV